MIKSDRTDPVTLEAKVKGPLTSVAFNHQGVDMVMRDDGTGGDRVAGDSIYTIVLQASQILSKLTASDVYRPFVGYVRLYQGSTVALQTNSFAEIWTPAISLTPLQQRRSDMQAASHVVNIAGPGVSGAILEKTWTAKFYSVFFDDYDFLNLVFVPGPRGNRYHFCVKNTVKGIGLSQVDNTKSYASSGKLQGITTFPIPSYFDGAETAHQHELGHQWINFLSGTPFQSGIPHWPMSDVASGVMGRSIPGSNVGGAFPYRLVKEGDNYRAVLTNEDVSFNDLELYLMGLLPPDSVGQHFVFTNQNQTVSQNALLLGPVVSVSIQDIVNKMGPRDPSLATSQKKFRIGTILISDSLLSPEAMSFYNYFAKRMDEKSPVPYAAGFAKGIAKPFFVLTGGRGEVDGHITLPAFALLQPIPAAPVDSAKNIQVSPTLSWNEMTGASSYHLQVSTLPTFASSIVNDSSLTTTSRAVGPLSLAAWYYWRVRAKSSAGYSGYSVTRIFNTIGTTSTEMIGREVPREYALSQNYPNPFNPSTSIRYRLPKGGTVSLTIYNTLGQHIATLVNEQRSPGNYQVQWDANVPSGIYLFRLQAGEFVETKKMILLR